MRPKDYESNVRPDGTASYLELNPVAPPVSGRGRGWDTILAERDHFLPFDNGEVTFDEHCIAVIKGPGLRMLYAADGRRYEGTYRDGDAIVSPAGMPVRWAPRDASDAVMLVFRPAFLERLVLEATGADPARIQLLGQPRTLDPVILRLADALIGEAEAGDVGERLYVESLSNLLGLHLLRRHSTLPPRAARGPDGGLSGPRLRRALDAIRDRIEDGASLAEIAEAAGVSPSHLSAQFRRSTGLSPHQYLIRCRVERAKELLRFGEPSLTLAQVAARAGFCDQGHLARHFRRLVGTTPTRYRESS